MKLFEILTIILMVIIVFVMILLYFRVQEEGSQCMVAPLEYGAKKDNLHCACSLIGQGNVAPIIITPEGIQKTNQDIRSSPLVDPGPLNFSWPTV